MTREEAERAFISAVLHDNNVLGNSDLNPDMFTTYRQVFERLVKLSDVGPVRKTDLLLNASERIVALVSELDPWSSLNWEFYAKAIKAGWKKQVLEEACRVAQQQDADEAITTLENAMDAVAQRDIGARTKTLGETLLPALEKIVAGKDNSGIMFGMEKIDYCTLGARQAQFIVIGARPSQGKSALMQKMVRHIAKTTMVGVVSIESDDDELTIRMIASEANVDSRLIISAALGETNMAKITDGSRRLVGIKDNVLIHDQGDLNWNTFKTVVRRMVKKGCRIIFVDYLQLIEYPGARNKTEEVATVSRKTKALAKSLKVPIVALAQLGRDADDKRPTLADFQHSSAIEQDCDQGWLIWHPKDKEGKPLDSRIIIAKARDGMTRDVKVRFDRPTLSFYEMEGEE